MIRTDRYKCKSPLLFNAGGSCLSKQPSISFCQLLSAGVSLCQSLADSMPSVGCTNTEIDTESTKCPINGHLNPGEPETGMQQGLGGPKTARPRAAADTAGK